MNGPPAKPTSAFSAGSSPPHEPHRLEHRRERLLRVGDEKPLDVRQRAQRTVDDGADSLDELDGHAHAEHRSHDVREQHGGIDVVPAHRLQRHLRAELRSARNLEEAVSLADGAVLREAAARLAHEPHRGALDRLTAERTHEKRGHDQARVARRS